MEKLTTNMTATFTTPTLSRPMKLANLWLTTFKLLSRIWNLLKRSLRLLYILMIIRTEVENIHAELLLYLNFKFYVARLKTEKKGGGGIEHHRKTRQIFRILALTSAIVMRDIL